mmetsp:Transcript_14614/g.16223  ORF Transcript_14614/g.16223 Transcript_14614/m.16223 type:complete len:81 (+) Transcript_14614:2036-2278(+)
MSIKVNRAQRLIHPITHLCHRKKRPCALDCYYCPVFSPNNNKKRRRKTKKKSNLEETTKKNLCLPPDSLEVFFFGSDLML